MRYLTVLTRFLCVLALLSGMVVVLPEQAQAAPPTCQWSSGGCTTTVWQWASEWYMIIDCNDGSYWHGGGGGQWGGNCPNS
jgi:hypothetical protein